MTSPGRAALNKRFPAFSYPSFRAYWLGGFLSDVGNWAQQTTIPYVVLHLTHQPVWVGIAGSAQLFTQIFAMVIGGRIADQSNRKLILIRANALMLVSSLMLALLLAAGSRSPVAIIAIACVMAWLYGLQHPSWQSMPTLLVPENVAQNASHLTITKFQAARAIGPILAVY